MDNFTRQYTEVQQLLHFNDTALVLKRIIDFTLDTEDISFYLKANTLLDWLDTNPGETDIKQRFTEILGQLYEFLNKKPKQNQQLLAEANALQKQYGYGAFSLGPISIKLHEGDIIGLVGENGNGKTTLLRLLCGELAGDNGTITYHFPYGDLYDLRTKLVYIPQRTDTWYGSMFDNLVFTATCYGYTPEENKLVVELVIARLGLRKFRKHSWKDLSSGYKMRFELARILLRKPKLLLIDEPLANLDILAQQTILEDFRYIAKSAFRPIGIILSSQQLYEVEKASDQVIFLKQGVQRNLHEENSAKGETEPELIIEFESPMTQAELHNALSKAGTVTLQFNGGTYIATFSGGHVTLNDFLSQIVEQNIPILYLRDITKSTRRFFVS